MECYLYLFEYEISKLHRKFWVGAAEDGDKTILKCKDSLLGCITTVYIWGRKLEVD